MKRRQFVFLSVLAMLVFASFLIAHIRDNRHSPKYKPIDLRFLTDGDFPIANLNGERILLNGVTFTFSPQSREGCITAKDYEDHPNDKTRVVVRIPEGLGLPSGRSWESFGGKLSQIGDAANFGYLLDVEVIGIEPPQIALERVSNCTLFLMSLLGVGLVGYLVYRAERHKCRWIRPLTRPSFCACCGYDLRATPSRCPECGAAPADYQPSQA